MRNIEPLIFQVLQESSTWSSLGITENVMAKSCKANSYFDYLKCISLIYECLKTFQKFPLYFWCYKCEWVPEILAKNDFRFRSWKNLKEIKYVHLKNKLTVTEVKMSCEKTKKCFCIVLKCDYV